jgi:sirohydrochlorin cobaltochelatase
MKTALILFAHGARDPEWSAPMRHIQMLVRAKQPDAEVDLAFLEFMSPSLSDCVAARVAAGARKIAVVPMFIAQGGHLKHELPEMMAQLRSTYPTVEFSLTGPIGQEERVMQAMAEAVCEVGGGCGVGCLPTP